MSSLSSEEMSAQRSDFGLRLSNSMAQYGPLCVGIDPHRQLLTDWGYNVDALGAELYSMRMLQAANGRAAAVKFQFSMFERYGSKGIAALERVLYAARQMGIITIVDCLHGAADYGVRIRRCLFQAEVSVACRRHHFAAILWRTLVGRCH